MAEKTVISLGGVTKTAEVYGASAVVVPTQQAETPSFNNPAVNPVVPESYQAEVANTHYEEPLQELTPIDETPLVEIKQLEPPEETQFFEVKDQISTTFWGDIHEHKTEANTRRDWVWVGVLVATILVAFGGVALNNKIVPTASVLAASSSGAAVDARELKGYSDWSRQIFGKVAGQSEDLDQDELTNLEEFKVGSDPKKYSSCDNEKSDSETLYDLVDPKSCKAITVADDEVLARVSQVMDLQRFNKTLASSSSSSQPISAVVDDIINMQFLSKDEVATAQQKLEQQKTYTVLLEKMAAYMEEYRSYGALDRDYELPVKPEEFLRVSLKYNIPMKYMMAIARLESRFGTDRYSDGGAETRPSQYKNMYSIGLDDSNNNLKYATWEDGVEGFARWYVNLEERDVSDCAKWKIFNPNGDYCSKVESTAEGFESFLVEKSATN